jgi:hypothetical protein
LSGVDQESSFLPTRDVPVDRRVGTWLPEPGKHIASVGRGGPQQEQLAFVEVDVDNVLSQKVHAKNALERHIEYIAESLQFHGADRIGDTQRELSDRRRRLAIRL